MMRHNIVLVLAFVWAVVTQVTILWLLLTSPHLERFLIDTPPWLTILSYVSASLVACAPPMAVLLWAAGNNGTKKE